MAEQTARDLVAYKNYTPTGLTETRLTRKLTLDQEWVFGGSGGVDIMIKFDKNFFKKHLFTYSKKTNEVAQIAFFLSKEAGDPPGREMDFWLQAELIKLNQKLRKALEHRAEAFRCTCGHYLISHACTNCGHGPAKHKTGSGANCACKEDTGAGIKCGCTTYTNRCVESGCACGGFTNTPTGAYATSRSNSGKGPDNPLQGAPTQVNTCIILDRIPMEKFKDVVIKSFETAETTSHTWAINTEKHLTWDFGIANCVVNASLGQAPKDWTTSTGVTVSTKKLSFTPASSGKRDLYTYQVFHLSN